MKYPFAETGQIPDDVLDAMKAAPLVRVKYTVDLPLPYSPGQKTYRRAKKAVCQVGVYDPIHPRYAKNDVVCLRDDNFGWWTVIEASKIIEFEVYAA